VKGVSVIAHPLVQHNLSRLRDRTTEPEEFRRILSEMAVLMIYEATRSLSLRSRDITTPLEKMRGKQLTREIMLVPILRAGLGMLNSILPLIPRARVGFIGLKRDEATLRAITYLESLPDNLSRFEVILIDPMLATGGSTVAALDRLKSSRAKHLRVVNIVAAPEGVRRVRKAHPEVPIFSAAIDRQLNDHGYILPGLGDAGDRMFGV
jgi:uracil phosphoribosyltransferase